MDSSGTLPDMTPLFVGSEGILGYITAIAVRLIAAPESARTMLAFFPEAPDAAGAVTGVLSARLMPSVMEFLDRATLKAITGYVPLEIPDNAKAMLLVEVDGKEEEVGEELQKVIELCREHGGFGIEEAEDAKARDRLWQLRRNVSPSLARLASGKINEDVCVPRGKMMALVEWCQALSEETGLQIPVYGHAADGNLHVNVMYDKVDPDQVGLAQGAVERILKKTLELGGTLSGEHGIGRTKRRYLHLQFSDEALKMFGEVKQALDPEGLFNPGVMLSDENSVESA
jgi:glycolate oxidase